MRIQLNRADLNAATLSWNILTSSKNRNKNYYIPTSIDDYERFDKYSARLKIHSREWILLENAVKAFDEIINRINRSSELKNVVSHKTVYMSLIKELETEISNIEKDSKNKRDFSEALESVQSSIDSKISSFDFFFPIEGLELEVAEKICCGKIEIFVFAQELRDQLIDAHFGNTDSRNPDVLAHTQEFFDQNLLNRLCVKSTAYGDYDTASKKAYKQARELINYFRFILCCFIHERVAEQMIKINLSSEAYSKNERILIRRDRDEAVILVSGHGRNPLQNFSIDRKRLENLSSDGFLDDFTAIINASSRTHLEGCILTSIYWIGEAQNESDLDVSFLKYWTAIECMFSEKEDTTKSLAKGVATVNAFSGYEFIKLEDVKNIYKDVSDLYDKRSQIIHQGLSYLADQVINESDIARICKYTVWSILSLFHLRSIGYTTMEQIRIQTNRLYTRWDT